MKAELGFQKVQSPVTICFPAGWEGGEITAEEKYHRALQFEDLHCLWGPTLGWKVGMEQGGMRRFQPSTDSAELCNHFRVLYEMSGQLTQGSEADFATYTGSLTSSSRA